MTGLRIVSPDTAFEDRARAALAEPDVTGFRWTDACRQRDPAGVVAEIVSDRPAVVCLGPGLDRDVMMTLAGRLDHGHPDICLVVAEESTPDLLEWALGTGVRDVISPDLGGEDLARSLRRALDVAERRRGVIAVSAAEPAQAQRVVTVVSPKGGSGKTMLVCNLSVELARRSAEVVVVDLDLQFGDVAAGLGLAPEHTIADMASAPVTLDATMMKVFLTRHRTGVFVLCAPESPIDGEKVSEDDGARAIKLLSPEFPTVIVDTAAGLDAPTLSAIDLSTDVVFVCSTDVASVRSLRKEIDALDSLGMTGHRRHLVLNRCDARVGLDPADIESVVGLRIETSVPSSRAVPLSLNEGTPLTEAQARSPIAKAIQSLAEIFVPAVAETRTSRRQWWR